jgi:hypothetical protein
MTPPYAISLSLPSHALSPDNGRVKWTRAGWSARGERRVELPGGERHVHLRVDLRGPWPLLVSGALVVSIDVALLAGCWLLGLVLAEVAPGSHTVGGSAPFRLGRSGAGRVLRAARARSRSGASRAWGRGARRARFYRQTLKDGSRHAGWRERLMVQAAVMELGRDSTPICLVSRRGVGGFEAGVSRLGLAVILAAPVFEHLALEDDLDQQADGRMAGRRIRIGYRIVVAGPPRFQAVLAAPQLLDDESVSQQQTDLALALLLAACGGLAAAIYLAGLSARGLARPVAALREAVVAVGHGTPLPAFPPGPLQEFAPVMRARSAWPPTCGRARRRSKNRAAALARGGERRDRSHAVDDELRITTANGRAAEAVGSGPRAERPAAEWPDAWLPVWKTVRDFVARGEGSHCRAGVHDRRPADPRAGRARS